MTMTTNNLPLISIGMPVFNEVKMLRTSLDALLSQDYEQFELLISDNASDDGTIEICTEYVNKDKRVKLYREPINKGSLYNFLKVFNLSSGKYFMWASGHDYWEKNFLSSCVKILENDNNVVLAYPLAKRIDPDGQFLYFSQDTIDTQGKSPIERFLFLITTIKTGVMFYGLFRKESLVRFFNTFNVRAIWGFDVIILTGLSLMGTFAYIPQPLFTWRQVRDENPEIRRKTVPIIMDPIGGHKKTQLTMGDLLHEMGEGVLEVIQISSLSKKNKDFLSKRTKQCFARRYSVNWPNENPIAMYGATLLLKKVFMKIKILIKYLINLK